MRYRVVCDESHRPPFRAQRFDFWGNPFFPWWPVGEYVDLVTAKKMVMADAKGRAKHKYRKVVAELRLTRKDLKRMAEEED